MPPRDFEGPTGECCTSSNAPSRKVIRALKQLEGSFSNPEATKLLENAKASVTQSDTVPSQTDQTSEIPDGNSESSDSGVLRKGV